MEAPVVQRRDKKRKRVEILHQDDKIILNVSSLDTEDASVTNTTDKTLDVKERHNSRWRKSTICGKNTSTKRARTAKPLNDACALDTSQPSSPSNDQTAVDLPHLVSTQAVEIMSDGCKEGSSQKTSNPSLHPKDGIIVRDFATRKNQSKDGCIVEGPKKSILTSSEQTNIIFLSSFEKTATCPVFRPEECSFTRADHDSGDQQAIDDENDDTEDEDEEVYQRACELLTQSAPTISRLI